MDNIVTIRQLFDYLNDEIDYLVLRNWDDLLEDNIYGDGHEDIDILCRSLDRFIELTQARPVFRLKYRNNYLVHIGKLIIRFDVRFVGDGYYPIKWEDEMLMRRKLNNDRVYIPSDEDYFYSLAYHALLQKPIFSDEYLKKVLDASIVSASQESMKDANEIRNLLLDFCIHNNYLVEIPSDPGVYLNTSNLKYFKVNKNVNRLTRKWLLNSGYKVKYILSQLFQCLK